MQTQGSYNLSFLVCIFAVPYFIFPCPVQMMFLLYVHICMSLTCANLTILWCPISSMNFKTQSIHNVHFGEKGPIVVGFMFDDKFRFLITSVTSAN